MMQVKSRKESLRGKRVKMKDVIVEVTNEKEKENAL